MIEVLCGVSLPYRLLTRSRCSNYLDLGVILGSLTTSICYEKRFRELSCISCCSLTKEIRIEDFKEKYLIIDIQQSDMIYINTSNRPTCVCILFSPTTSVPSCATLSRFMFHTYEYDTISGYGVTLQSDVLMQLLANHIVFWCNITQIMK